MRDPSTATSRSCNLKSFYSDGVGDVGVQKNTTWRKNHHLLKSVVKKPLLAGSVLISASALPVELGGFSFA